MEKHEFKPKEWVLVRDFDEQKWKLDIFSHYIEGNMYPYRCVSHNYVQCLPYAGNESLLGTADTPETRLAKELGEWKVGDKVEVEFCMDDAWHEGEIVAIDANHRDRSDNELMPFKVRSRRFEQWNSKGELYCAARQIRKPEKKSGNKEERFAFGDKVQWRDLDDGEWREGLIIETDLSDIPYKVATIDGNVHWRRKEDVRRAEG